MSHPGEKTSQSPATPAGPSHHWRVVPLLMMVVALGHFNRIGMSVAGTEKIIPQYGIAEERMGIVYSAFLFAYTLAMIPGGWFIDRFGPRACLMVFCFGSVFFVALTGLSGIISEAAGMIMALLVVRSAMGVVNAPLHPASAYMVFRHVSPDGRSFANGLVTFAACIGISATYYGIGPLMDAVGWQQAFLACSLLTLCAGIVWVVGTQPLASSWTRQEIIDSTSRLKDLGKLLADRNVICITLSYAALGYFQYLFFYWIQYYFKTVQQQGVDVSRWYSTLITLAMGVGMACGGWLADRVSYLFWPRVRRGFVPAAGLMLSGLVFEAGLLSSNPQTMLATFALSAALLGACEGAFWTTVIELGGESGGAAAGVMNMGGNLGGTLSPYLTPLLSSLFGTSFGEEIGWRLSLAVAGAVSILGAALWWGVETRDREVD